ncbi:PREDICTED: uncharacterized protein LOC109583579 [Amphimedon queenslandica]|uniref:Uncharacterized protein n=1 Tax=Amphimedon queenslandica TaxID=400682 RepID=A0AAN0JC32_AMPQE|nr:PREDICTED: uncharacterized protein LOC109583579 [Amphimedon queenslandica]|eukprot:XP_019854559.1 PREDICTED: uncharacterized protein LOC109583579 [Amphimedon queenslandica]
MSILDDSVVLLNMLISISVKITSLIHDSTWSVAVNVSDRFGSDTTDYTNITDNSEAIQDCNPMTSSSVSQASSSNILSSVMTYTVYPFSSPVPSVTPSGESGRSSWTSTDTTLVVFGGVALLCIAVVIYAVMYKAKNNRTSCNIQNVVNKVKGLKLIDTSMVSRITIESSPVSSADIVNENYGNVETSFQTDQDPLPLAPNEEPDEATPDSEDVLLHPLFLMKALIDCIMIDSFIRDIVF